MKKLLLILLCLPLMTLGQNVNIPDANFKAYLVWNTIINTNGDTEIQLSEANSFGGAIACPSMNITDLTGIEAFTALTDLDCDNNLLTSLDVSNNTNLTELWCGNNQLTSLDVSNNTALTYLNCTYNNLTSLDVSQNTVLTHLMCRSNQLTSLDVSTNIALNVLSCGWNQLTSLDVSQNTALNQLISKYNQLTSLDVSANTYLTVLFCDNNLLTNLDVRNGNNTSFSSFSARNNPNLSCINVDNAAWSTNNMTNIDSWASFSTNCSGTTSIQEHITNKELLKVTDLLGRETKQTNQPLFYIYDDGTVEKRIVIE